jgi:hypothetical protein
LLKELTKGQFDYISYGIYTTIGCNGEFETKYFCDYVNKTSLNPEYIYKGIEMLET